jgi:hypothetical protein
MMVTVDEPRQYHLAPGADHRGIGMACGELGEGADLGDDAVALQQRAVVNLLPFAAVDGFGEDGKAADVLEGMYSLLIAGGQPESALCVLQDSRVAASSG